MTDWGTISIDRINLRETTLASETGGGARSLSVSGQESMPPLTRTQLVVVHDNLLALQPNTVLPVTFTDKPERNGYYTLNSASADLDDQQGEIVKSTWKLELARIGTENEVDLQSRLSGTVRANDFSLSGERWHAPPIGHYAYYTGANTPSTMTRAGEDGTMTVYRGIPAGASPRWGCDPANYGLGRVRVLSDGMERTGIDTPIDPANWEISNGLIKVTPDGPSNTLNVQAYTGGAWRSKIWDVFVTSGTIVIGWDSVTVLRNDMEMATIRLSKALNPGRATLDLTLRRGSRIVEGYLQRGAAADQLKVRLATAETNNTATASAGYVTATNDDADGNRFAAGSARAFTGHANGGVQLNNAAKLDFWVGVSPGTTVLNSNPDFETGTGTSGWTAAGGATLTQSSTAAHHGTFSAKITPNGVTANPRIEADMVPVAAGQAYRASAWVYSPGGYGNVSVSVNWYDAANTYLSTSFNVVAIASGTWTFLDNTFNAPASAAKAGLVPTEGGTPLATDVLYVDEVKLRTATPSGDAPTDLRNQYIGSLPERVYGVRR